MGSLTVCDDHGVKLRLALSARGLAELIGGEDYDPLAGAMLGAVRAAIYYGGPQIMDAGGCPFCMANANSAGLGESWVQELTDEEHGKAREKGLTAGPAGEVEPSA
jgi:hypothetical protein